jgi:hypothetical protein
VNAKVVRNAEGVILRYPAGDASPQQQDPVSSDAQQAYDINLDAELGQLIREELAHRNEERARTSAPNGHDKFAPPKVVLRRAHEIVAEQRETTWLIHKIIEAHVLAVIAGARGTFKSFIALDWVMRIAQQGHTVVILSGEGAGLDRRIDAWMRTHAPETDLSTLPVFVLERVLNLSLILDMEGLREAFEGLPEKPAVVVVDTFSKFSAGLDENDNSEVAAYLSLLSENIRDAFKATVILVAHSGHGDAKRPRGASSLMANPDAEYIVNRPDAAGMTVTVTRERFKDGSAQPALVYEATVVDLGRRDRYGDAVTSLALIASANDGDTAGQATKPRGKNQEKALIALNEWGRANPAAEHITSIAITEIFKAQQIYPKRRKEVLDYLVNIRVLTPSIGGFTIDQAML